MLLNAVIAFVISFIGTPIARSAAKGADWLDIATDRSSHTRPTPRTGGFAIVAAIIIPSLLVGVWHDAALINAIEAALLLVILATVDQLRPLNRKLRLAVQILVATIAIFAGGFLPRSIDLPFVTIDAKLPLIAISLFWVVGVVNVYNFMDGINGIAAVEAIVCGISMALLFMRSGDSPAALLAACIAGAAAGFLPWNLPSGSIFMGDTGSVTFGFLFALLALRAPGHGITMVAAALPLLPFLFDSGVTLVRRALQGEAFFSSPHRSHFYQRLNRLGWTHAQVAGVWAALAVMCAALAVRYDGLTDFAKLFALAAVIAMNLCVALWITLSEQAVR